MEAKTERQVYLTKMGMSIPVEIVDVIRISKSKFFYEIKLHGMEEFSYTVTSNATLRVSANNYYEFQY